MNNTPKTVESLINEAETKWASQGRTDEQKWAVRNFITGSMQEAITALNELRKADMAKNEVWVPVSGYEGYYEVSNLGNVRSIARMTVGRWEKLKTSPAKSLKGDTMKNGYKRVELSKDGRRHKIFVHRLVAIAYIPNPSDKPCVNHIDNDRANNQVGNLEWCTHQENTDHAKAQGRIWRPSGKDHHSAHITHCPKGHEYSGYNLVLTGANKTNRNCRECMRQSTKRYRARLRAEERLQK